MKKHEKEKVFERLKMLNGSAGSTTNSFVTDNGGEFDVSVGIEQRVEKRRDERSCDRR